MGSIKSTPASLLCRKFLNGNREKLLARRSVKLSDHRWTEKLCLTHVGEYCGLEGEYFGDAEPGELGVN